MPLTPMARTTPTGQYLDDGLSTKVTLNNKPGIAFWEKTVKPPGVDGGDAIDVATMFNTKWRVRAARSLRTMTDITCKALYDPAVYTDIESQINVEQACTITFPNGDTIAFYGFLRHFEPDEASEATAPMATVTFSPTNRDPATGAEVDPVIGATLLMAMYRPNQIRALPAEKLAEMAEEHGIEDAKDMDKDNLIYALCRLTVDDKQKGGKRGEETKA